MANQNTINKRKSLTDPTNESIAKSKPSVYLDGIYRPVSTENEFHSLTIQGSLPKELNGAYLMNSPNPHFQPKGRYHLFDGDGMIHGIFIENGQVTYRNRYIRTDSFRAEEKAGKALWTGIMEAPSEEAPNNELKNTSNTDLIFHSGKLLSLWYLCERPYQLEMPNLETKGPYSFDNTLKRGMSAHPKVDKITGEMMFMDYSYQESPYLTYGVVSKDGKLIKQSPIEIPGPRILHDLAITENYTILIDVPLYWKMDPSEPGKRKIRFDKSLPARFGILPRHGDNSTIRWFECSTCYIYHTINAYEEGDEIILTGCRVADLYPSSRIPREDVPRLDYLELKPFFYKWTFNLKTGSCREEQLDDVMSEFPRMNNEFLGRKTRYSYNPRIARKPSLLFDGLIKYDAWTGTSQTIEFGKNCYGSEAVFCPKAKMTSESQSAASTFATTTTEDDGWVVTFIHDDSANRSSFVVYDAKDWESGPIATVPLPHRIPMGFHATWIPDWEMKAQD